MAISQKAMELLKQVRDLPESDWQWVAACLAEDERHLRLTRWDEIS